MSEKPLKIVSHGDFFHGNFRIAGETWVLGCSARGYVWAAQAQGDLMVTEELPENIAKSGDEYDEKVWQEEMRKIRDLVIARARALVREKRQN